MNKFRKHFLIILSGLFFLMAIYQENQTLNNHPEIKLIQAFRKTFFDQEAKLSKYMANAEKKITSIQNSGNDKTSFSELNYLFENQGIGFIVYKDKKIIFWFLVPKHAEMVLAK